MPNKMEKIIPGTLEIANIDYGTGDEFIIKDGITDQDKVSVFLEIADTQKLRERGLQNRKDLADGHGMLFNKAGAFWMKDVNFPLDLLFLDDMGKILEIITMPVDKDGENLYTPTNRNSSMAVELNGGYCDTHDIQVGDIILKRDNHE